MASKTHAVKNDLDKRMPDVFERLSKQNINKMNSRKGLVAQNRSEIKKSRETNYSSVYKKRASLNQQTPVKDKMEIKSNVTSEEYKLKKDANVDTYHEKVEMERIPETFDKDLDEFEDKRENPKKKKSACNEMLNECKLISDKEQRVVTLDDLVAEINSDKECTSLHSNVDLPAPSESAQTDFSSSQLSLISWDHKLNNKFKVESFNISSEEASHIPPNCEFVPRNSAYQNISKILNLNTCKSDVLHRVDDDKDICDIDKDEEDEEFYNIKVQTRLVSYKNSTLVIKETSKQDEPLYTYCTSHRENINNADSLSDYSLPYLPSNPTPELCTTATENLHTTSCTETRGRFRGKINQLFTKGRSLLSEVRSVGISTDIKGPLRKLNDSLQSSLYRSITYPFIAIETDIENKNIEAMSTEVMDSGVCSLSSSFAVENLDSLENSENIVDEIRTEEMEVSTKHYRESNKHIDDQAIAKDNIYCGDSSLEAGGDDSDAFTKYFETCSCHLLNTTANSFNETKFAETCSCQQEVEFPTEIKELLDADYARMWWTITGNFGNILPIDWTKTYARQKYLPALNLNEAKNCKSELNSLEALTSSKDDEEEVAQDLDLHHMVGTQQEVVPVKSAEEVIKEIDDIMQEGSSSEDEDSSTNDTKSDPKSELEPLPPPLIQDKLKNLNVNELNDSLMELEGVIRRYSETLISQLALRDEMEYEKELKNTFISLILQVQSKRRVVNVDKKKIKKTLGPNGVDPKYLTTVIPYDVGHGPPSNETIQILIKILTAINEDSPTVPTLLTDYILKVLCPS